MKRIIALVLAAAVLLSGCSARNAQRQENTANLYYAVANLEKLSSRQSVLSETREVQSGVLSQLLEIYFQGPDSDKLRSPFPVGTTVLELQENAEQVTLVLSGEYFTLSGIGLSIANYCLAKTVCEYTGVEQVLLADELGQVHLLLQPETFLVSDELNVERESTYTLFFPDENRQFLLPEVRTVSLSENETPEAYIVRQLMEGPDEESKLPLIPKGTKLIDVSTNGGTCSVNFTHEFCDNRFDDKLGAFLTIFGIVNSLTTLENVDNVEFLVDGALRMHYGPVPLGQPIFGFNGVIGKVQHSADNVNIHVHVETVDSHTTLELPARISDSAGQNRVELVLRMLLAYEAPQGFQNPIPFGTELLGMSVSGEICYVDLSRKFIPEEDTKKAEEAAVMAIVSPLVELDGISGVVLSIEGESSGIQYVDITRVLNENNVVTD